MVEQTADLDTGLLAAVKRVANFETAAHVLISCFGLTSFSNIKTFFTHAGHEPLAAITLAK